MPLSLPVPHGVVSLGAVRRWAAEREPEDLFFVSDLHAMTTPHRP
ncbi:tryptophan--tRNA ligase, partial [Saccharopolyspora sp. NPDC002376]